MDAPTTAYTEVQIDEDSISLTLISESGSNGPVIEDTERFTFEELQDMAGEHLTLRLSTDSRDALVDSRESAVVGNLLQSENLSEAAEEMPDNPTSEQLLAYMGLLGGGATDGVESNSQESGDSQESGLPEVGDCLTDQNPPSWSDNEYLEVVEVLPHVRCDEYVIQGRNEGEVVPRPEQDWTDETVATANPSYDEDEAVVMAQYEGTGDWYAFPASRLA